MSRWIVAAAIGCLYLSAPAYAATISGSAIFDVVDPDDNLIATGSWMLERNRVVDFELIVGDVAWDEFDIGHRCGCEAFLPDVVRSVSFQYADPAGNFWTMSFSFFDGNFGIFYDVNGVFFSGTSENSQLFAPGTYDVFVEVPEADALSLFALGILALALARRSVARA